jgi:predicted nucleotidyltransferase
VTGPVPGAVIAQAARALLEQFDHVEAAIVYGSVARGTATAASDVDLLVLTTEPVTAQVAARLRQSVRELQLRLGYQPDAHHVVELFAVRACVEALTGPLVLRAVYQAATGREIDRLTLDSDDLEVLRALLDQHLTVLASPVLEGLVGQARSRVDAASRHLGVSPNRVLAGIGLVRATASPCSSSLPPIQPEAMP